MVKQLANEVRQDQKSDDPGTNGSFVQSPVISLPKGGGAIRDIGEKFTANPVTGTGSMVVPIATSPGRSSFGPQLSLSYRWVPAMVLSDSAGTYLFPPLREKLTRDCPSISMEKSERFYPVWCRRSRAGVSKGYVW